MKVNRKDKHSFNPATKPYPWAMEKYFNFYINEVQPLVAQYGTQPATGMHGLETHTNAVVFRGIDYSLSLHQDPTPVVLACAFHDMARVNDEPDSEHGKNAVPMAMKILKQFPNIDRDTRLAIYSAILNHTDGKSAPDYISACLWDADRTRMSWKYGFDDKFFNTPRGAYVAEQYFQKYVEFQKKLFPAYQWAKAY